MGINIYQLSERHWKWTKRARPQHTMETASCCAPITPEQSLRTPNFTQSFRPSIASKSMWSPYKRRNARKTDIGQLSDGNLVIHKGEFSLRNVAVVGFVVHPSLFHLVMSLYRYTWLLFFSNFRVKNGIASYCPPTCTADESELDAFYNMLEKMIHNAFL